MQANRPASQHRGEGEGALPEDMNIGFSGKGSGIYAPFGAQKQLRSSYLGQPGEMEGEAPIPNEVDFHPHSSQDYAGKLAHLLFIQRYCSIANGVMQQTYTACVVVFYCMKC